MNPLQKKRQSWLKNEITQAMVRLVILYWNKYSNNLYIKGNRGTPKMLFIRAVARESWLKNEITQAVVRLVILY